MGAELPRLGPGEGTAAAGEPTEADEAPPAALLLKPWAEKLTLCGMAVSATCWNTGGIMAWPPGGYSLCRGTSTGGSTAHSARGRRQGGGPGSIQAERAHPAHTSGTPSLTENPNEITIPPAARHGHVSMHTS